MLVPLQIGTMATGKKEKSVTEFCHKSVNRIDSEMTAGRGPHRQRIISVNV